RGWRALGSDLALDAVGIEPSVGSAGDSYDYALAESIIGPYKTEEIRRRGPWRGMEDVEFATLEWVAWYSTRRLLEPLCFTRRVRPSLLPSPDGSRRAGDTHVISSPGNPGRFKLPGQFYELVHGNLRMAATRFVERVPTNDGGAVSNRSSTSVGIRKLTARLSRMLTISAICPTPCSVSL